MCFRSPSFWTSAHAGADAVSCSTSTTWWYRSESPCGHSGAHRYDPTGRSEEYKKTFLRRLWDIVQQATNAPDDRLVLGITELAASQAMEMGRVMPDVSAGASEQDA